MKYSKYILPIFLVSLILGSLVACSGHHRDAFDPPMDAASEQTPNYYFGNTYPDSGDDGSSIPIGPNQDAGPFDNQIPYHGGPVLTGTTHVYLIWYGDWAGNTGKTIIPDLINSIGGSPYYNINTTYFMIPSALDAGVDAGMDAGMDGSCDLGWQYVSNQVQLINQTDDAYSKGKQIMDDDVWTILVKALNDHKLAVDENAVYFILTSSDVVDISGECLFWCGWHFNGSYNGFDIKYALVPNAEVCMNSCSALDQDPDGGAYLSPNDNPGVDSMASVVLHELEETATDPDLNAWYDWNNGGENADKCAWKFGTTYPTTNGAKANMRLGNRDYLIQQNWVNALGGYCALEWSKK